MNDPLIKTLDQLDLALRRGAESVEAGRDKKLKRLEKEVERLHCYVAALWGTVAVLVLIIIFLNHR